MSIISKMNEDINKFVKSGNNDSRDMLKYLKGEIERASKTLNKKIDDELCLSVIQKIIKQAEDSKTFSIKFHRLGAVKKIEQEIEIYKTYLPSQMGETEAENVVVETINKLNATGKKDMGLVMKYIKDNYSGQDMKLFSKIVMGKLQ